MKDRLEKIMIEAEHLGSNSKITKSKVKMLLGLLHNNNYNDFKNEIFKLYASIDKAIPQIISDALLEDNSDLFYPMIAGFTNALTYNSLKKRLE